jgi:hypothetical protein
VLWTRSGSSSLIDHGALCLNAKDGFQCVGIRKRTTRLKITESSAVCTSGWGSVFAHRALRFGEKNPSDYSRKVLGNFVLSMRIVIADMEVFGSRHMHWTVSRSEHESGYTA